MFLHYTLIMGGFVRVLDLLQLWGSPQLVDEVFTECKNCFFVRDFVFVDVGRGNTEKIVIGGIDLLSCGGLIILPDMHQEHMQVEQFFLLHAIT